MLDFEDNNRDIRWQKHHRACYGPAIERGLLDLRCGAVTSWNSTKPGPTTTRDTLRMTLTATAEIDTIMSTMIYAITGSDTRLVMIRDGLNQVLTMITEGQARLHPTEIPQVVMWGHVKAPFGIFLHVVGDELTVIHVHLPF